MVNRRGFLPAKYRMPAGIRYFWSKWPVLRQGGKESRLALCTRRVFPIKENFNFKAHQNKKRLPAKTALTNKILKRMAYFVITILWVET